MKTLTFIIASVFFSATILAQDTSRQVSEAVMEKVYQEVKTPYKYGLVLAPETSAKKFDCPTVFQHNGKWYMSYIVFDGRGYETWLARSEDLLQWTDLGKLLSFSDTADWDNNQKAGYPALQDTKWGGSYKLKKYKGKYWMSYIGGNQRGYETGDLAIGIASTDADPSKPHEWKRRSAPALSSHDSGIRWWENKKLFKSSIILDPAKSTGFEFLMYYNANGDSSGNVPKLRWFERIGLAGSHDMITWHRIGKEPVMHHPVGITGDAVVQKWGDLWIMFYFGAFWEGRKDAFNRFACSVDLINWTDWKGSDLINSTEEFDARFAHKPFVLKHRGTVYHFYCAVDKNDNRGIAVATSVDLGKSKIKFVTR